MEVWKDLKFYEDEYEINTSGEVRSKRTGRMKVAVEKDNGYFVYNLWINGKGKQEYVHRLVALTFLSNPNNYPQVNHKDEDKRNNKLDNLEWCDARYNNTYGTARQRMAVTQKLTGATDRARQRWLDRNPAKVNPKTHGSNSYAKSVVCDDHIFSCIKDCAEYYGVNYATMRYWLSGDGNIPKYFKEHDLHYL